MNALELNNLKKTYKNGVEALKGIDLNIAKGEFFALLGANGAGKSTAIGLITTLIFKSSGKILINGFDLDKNAEKAKSCIGLVPQEFNLNIFENITQVLITQAGFYGVTEKKAKLRAIELLKQLGLWEKRDHIVRHLSGGMKRRLMIARALMHEPEILILDEPTAGVDIEIRRSMWDFLIKLNNQGVTIILTTHYLEEAEYLCKQVAIIDQGKIVKNTTMRKLLRNFDKQTFVFNCENSFHEAPVIPKLDLKLIDENTLEVKVDNKTTLNEVFLELNKHNFKITSMRNKTNRLEELFMDIIRHDI